MGKGVVNVVVATMRRRIVPWLLVLIFGVEKRDTKLQIVHRRHPRSSRRKVKGGGVKVQTHLPRPKADFIT